MSFILLALRWVGGILKAIPWQAYAVLGALAGVWLLWSAHTSAVSEARSAGDKTGYTRATAEFVAAQAEAEDLAFTKVVKAITKQTDISTEATHAHQTVRADIDSRADAIRVRHDSRARASGGVDLPTVPRASSRPDAETCTDGLPFSPALSALTEAEKNTAQLVALQGWVRDQQKAASNAQ